MVTENVKRRKIFSAANRFLKMTGLSFVAGLCGEK